MGCRAGWCGGFASIRTSYKENLTYPVITACPAQRGRGICSPDFRPGENVYCICSTGLFTQRPGGLLKDGRPPLHSCGASASCVGQAAPAWLQADGPLMPLQALGFGPMEMDGWVSSGEHHPHPPQRGWAPSSVPLNPSGGVSSGPLPQLPPLAF